MKPLKILMSAYACQPAMGSEPGVGWNVGQELAKYHRVWVLTRRNNRPAIEAELSVRPNANLTFLYCDPPGPARWLPPTQVPHYYGWQIGAYFAAKALLQQVDLDLIHHVTYVRYSTPSFLALLPVPFVWGPVGGGEAAPAAFWQGFSRRGQGYEVLRSLIHRLGELDPFTQMTARRSALTQATTADTARRLQHIGAKDVRISPAIGLSQQELQQLSALKLTSAPKDRVRFVSVARLLHWKGLHLSLRAFAEANLDEAEYWFLGEGPEKQRLQAIAADLDLGDRVKFLGSLPRAEVLAQLQQCDVLLHPSLHESGGLVCLEAMAAGLPVICLDLGGPSLQVTAETGCKIAAHNPQQTIQDLAAAIAQLAQDPQLRTQMGQAGQRRAQDTFSWSAKGQELIQHYAEICREVAPCAF
ncbi:glycosyltransferase [Leptolyngbya sp. CCNP1308]|uniref:glycosyltransferase n=1 Tax=Leptolyngbya sp. CCNP1308 TaxID=3110255 RepID=UPI002B219AD1|nr:glycosyltransferase [Leptolyngbya sp. CCNP1308]MEA5448611.1 glycosyltransferase [Leptolyngbya sp. CCNP1308]